jgi:hypothetical protein
MKKLPTLKIEQRQRLYYKQYRYAIELNWSGFEYLDNLALSRVIAQFNRRVAYSWNRTYLTQEQVVMVAHHLADFEQSRVDIKSVNQWHTRFYYTNNATDIEVLKKIPEIAVVSFREADVCLPDGVLLRKNNSYKYRTYFRERKMADPAQGVEFLEKITAYGDYFGLNPTTRLRLAMGRHSYPFTRHSYIDHNSESDRVMLALIMPGFLGSTIAIQAK